MEHGAVRLDGQYKFDVVITVLVVPLSQKLKIALNDVDAIELLSVAQIDGFYRSGQRINDLGVY